MMMMKKKKMVMMIGEISGFQGDEYEDVFWDVAS
jgi:hypothetical protein